MFSLITKSVFQEIISVSLLGLNILSQSEQLGSCFEQGQNHVTVLVGLDEIPFLLPLFIGILLYSLSSWLLF